MIPTQQNIAIAETQGWIDIIEQHPERYEVAPLWGAKKGDNKRSLIPYYHNSLDAIVTVVRAMPMTCENGDRRHKDQVSVAVELGRICFPDPACLATPAQWCEAYLKVEGLWK
jgi:hypothetical protein